MKILLFTHYYPPEVNAPAARASENCRIWAQLGQEVTVVTCAPNHPSGVLYPGYRNALFQVEIQDGVRVIRIWTFLAANRGFVRRTLNYLSYLVSATLLLPLLPRADIVISTSPQFFCGLAGYVAKMFTRKPWALEIRDIWPESIVTVNAMRSGLATRLLERLEIMAYRSADIVVAVTDSFAPHIAERRGDPRGICVIKNGADLRRFIPQTADPIFKGSIGCAGRFVVSYIGTHGMAHGLDTILESAELLRDDARIIFLLVGDGADRARIEALRAKKGLDNVLILGQRPRSDVPQILAATDVGLILLRRRNGFLKVLPSKMFEVMAMSRPIILGVEGEARQLLEDAGAGIAITPESATELADAVRRLADDPALAARLGAQGNTYVRAHYDRDVLARRYLDILQTTACNGAQDQTAS